MTQSESNDRIARLESRIDELEAQLGKLQAGRRVPRQRSISRSALLKGAAAGVAGLAAAELSGTLSATPSFAGTTTDNNIVATGGSGTGVQVGGKSGTDYGYYNGGLFYGNSTAIAGNAVDSSGALNGGTGVYAASASGYGVYATSSSAPGVYSQSGSGDGVFGLSTNGNGVEGRSSTGIGVYGFSSHSEGVHGESLGWFGGWFAGPQAPIYLQPAGAAGPPSAGNHSQGEIMIDNTGVPYVCSAGNGTSLGTWQAIGNLRSFPNPRRVYQNTGVTNGTNYPAIDATKKLNGTASGVPAGATAAYCAVQAIPATANPRLAIGANDGTFNPGIANFTAPVLNTLNLTYMLVPLSSDGKFQFTSYLDGAVYFDVWGVVL